MDVKNEKELIKRIHFASTTGNHIEIEKRSENTTQHTRTNHNFLWPTRFVAVDAVFIVIIPHPNNTFVFITQMDLTPGVMRRIISWRWDLLDDSTGSTHVWMDPSDAKMCLKLHNCVVCRRVSFLYYRIICSSTRKAKTINSFRVCVYIWSQLVDEHCYSTM